MRVTAKKRVPLNFNLSSTSNPEVFFEEALRILARQICITAPGKILEYDRATHRARIQPLLKLRYSDEEVVEAEPITVEVYRMCAGGYVIDLPIKKGDTGWFISSDRDVTEIKETGDAGLPSSSEVHSFKRGFWIPDAWKDIEIDEEDDDALVIQYVGDDEEKEEEEEDPLPTSKIVVRKNKIEFTGDVSIAGNLKVTEGTITTANGVILDSHIHTGGILAGLTGTPVPVDFSGDEEPSDDEPPEENPDGGESEEEQEPTE